MDSVGAGWTGDIGDRVVGGAVRGGEGGVSIVGGEFRRGSEVRVPVGSGVSRVAHIQDCGVSVGGRELAGGVQGGLTVALWERPSPSPSPSTTTVVSTVGRVLCTDQVLRRYQIVLIHRPLVLQ